MQPDNGAELQQQSVDVQYEMVSWDWKEEANIEEISEAVQRISGGRVFITHGETGSDQVAVIVSSVPLNYDDATKLIEDLQLSE